MSHDAGYCRARTPMLRVLKAGLLPALFIFLCLAPVACLAGQTALNVQGSGAPPVMARTVQVQPQAPGAPVPGAPAGAFQPGLANKKPVDLGRITGRLLTLHGRKPLAGGTVYFFNAAGPPPSRDMYWRVPDKTAPIDAEGKFSVELPVGMYYMGAVKRASGKKELGPPRNRDLFFGAEKKNGKPREFQIKKDEVLDVGTFADAAPFKRKTKGLKGITAIEGRIYGQDGKPVKGVIVFAYIKSAMSGRPLFVSDKTGPDGKYMLRVNKGGVYYLRARNQYGGGKPKSGSLIGNYGYSDLAIKKKGIGIAVETRQIVGSKDIKVLKVPERRQVNGSQPGQVPQAPISPAPPAMINPVPAASTPVINGAAR